MQRRGSAFDIVVLSLVLTAGVTLLLLTMTYGRNSTRISSVSTPIATEDSLSPFYPRGTHVEKEQQERQRFENHTKAQLIVVVLDREYRFSACQRAELVEVIANQWESKWDAFPEKLLAGPCPIPRGLAGIMESRLTEDQKLLWLAPWRIDSKGRKVMGLTQTLGAIVRIR